MKAYYKLLDNDFKLLWKVKAFQSMTQYPEAIQENDSISYV